LTAAAIEVEDLRKSYGSNEAVRGISFDVGAGEVFGFLGPNGAVKAATIEILEGYRAVWSLAAVVVAARRFRWEPQAARG